MTDEQNPYDAYNTYDEQQQQPAEQTEPQAVADNTDLGPPDSQPEAAKVEEKVEQQIDQHPQGFGAERDMLQEEYVSIPEQQTPATSENQSEGQAAPQNDNRMSVRSSASAADQKVHELIDLVKQQHVPQITALNQQFEALNSAAMEEQEAQTKNKFSVSNPIKMEDNAGLKIGQVVKYTVTGVDQQGQFEVQRRYNEFLAVNKALNDRWPGCYIPAIPEKQFIGDKDEGFVEERRQLLERFIHECAKYSYIIESAEFQMFAKEGGEVTERFEKMPKQTPGAILDKFRLNFPKIQEESANEMGQYRERINTFSQFLAKCQSANQQNRDSMATSVKHQKQNSDDYKQLYTILMQYEASALEYFSENDMNSRVLTHPKAGDLNENLTTMVGSFRNPFLEAAVWIKGEMLDIAGMLNAMKGRDLVMKRQMATEGRKRDDQQELEKLSLGKTTLKSFFKSKTGKEQDILKLQASIEQANVEIEEYRKLNNFITVYQGQFAIEKFKKDKINQYTRMLNLMAIKSVYNANLFTQLSNQVLELQQQE